MTLDPGIAAVGVGVCGTVIAAIIKFGPSKDCQPDAPPTKVVSKDLCDERSGRIFDLLVRIERKLDAHIAHQMEAAP